MDNVRTVSRDRSGDAIILAIAIVVLLVSALSSALVVQGVQGRDVATEVQPPVGPSLVDLEIPRTAMLVEARGPIIDLTPRAAFIRLD